MSVTTLPTAQLKAEFPSNQRDVINGITSVLAAVPTGRGVLDNVRIRFSKEKGSLTVTSCDSYRIHELEVFTTTPMLDGEILVPGLQLKAGLPKPSIFKADAGPLTFTYGSTEYFTIGGAGTSATMEARSATDERWPNTDGLLKDFATDFHHNGLTDEPIGFNPQYVADIAAAGKRIRKEDPMCYTPGSTPLKPTMWELRIDQLHFKALLMPVRLERSY